MKVSGRAQILVVLVALSGLAGFAAWGLPGLDPTRLRPFAPHGANGVLAASLLAFLSFGGFDMADAALAFGGPLGRRLILACALLTTAATANAVLVVTSRIVFAMARDRFLPVRLAAVSARTGTPGAAVVANGLLMGTMAALGTVTASAAGGSCTCCTSSRRWSLRWHCGAASRVTGRPSPPPLPGWSCRWPSRPVPCWWWPAAAPDSRSAPPGS